MVTYAQLIASSEVDVARPILGEVAATIADVQVRNRGTIGGNVCVERPDEPPSAAARRARRDDHDPRAGGERTVPADEFFLGVYMTAVGEGELLTKVTVPAASGAGDGFAALTIGTHGTCIVNAAAASPALPPRIAIGCVAGTPVRATAMEERLAGGDFAEATSAPRPRVSARRSIRRRTSTRPPTTAATWPRSRPCARSPQAAERGGSQ